MQIVVLGDINADLTLGLPAFPTEGGDSTAHSLAWSSGGTALNAAAMLATLGAHARLCGRVGAGPTARVALGMAEARGVDLTGVQVDPQLPTGLCTVAVSGAGQRTFMSYRGANVAYDGPALPTALPLPAALYITAYTLLEGPLRTATLAAIDQAHTHGIPVVLDLGISPTRQCRADLLALLPRVWLLTLNELELELLMPGKDTLDALAALLAAGVHTVAFKRGAQGCLLARKHEHMVALPPNIAAIDTNGCGDAFAAGCAWALLRGADLAAAAALANTLGALTATRPGAADALPTYDEVRTHADARWLDERQQVR